MPLHSIPVLITARTFWFHLPVDIYLHSPFNPIIPFHFHPTQFSIPHPVQVCIPFPSFIPVSTAGRVRMGSLSAFHSNSIPIAYYSTLPIPSQSLFHCVSLPLLIPSGQHAIAFGSSRLDSDFRENILPVFWWKDFKSAWPVSRISSSGNVFIARTRLRTWTIFIKKGVPHSDVLEEWKVEAMWILEVSKWKLPL